MLPINGTCDILRIMKHLITLLLTFTLVACGGGGGGGSASPSNTPSVTAAFAEISNAMTISTPYNYTFSIIAVPVDINGDGKDDLVVHHFTSQYGGTIAGNAICPNELKVYTYQGNGSFKDETSTYIQGSTDLGGCSRKVRVADINNDGKMDVLFALNQEDGRIDTNAQNYNGQLAALISSGSQYVVQKFGTPNWYHTVGVLYDSTNRPLVTGNGFTTDLNQSFYVDSSNNPQPSGVQLPLVSSIAFEFFNTAGTKAESKFLLQSNNNSIVYSDVEGFVKTPDNTWTKLQNFSLAPMVGDVQGICWNGNNCGTNPVFQIDNKYVTFAGMPESCQLKLSPTSEQVVIFKFSGSVIQNYVNHATITQNNLPLYTRLKAVTIHGNQIVDVPLNIDNEQTDNINSNFFDCKDINGDGYQDIIVYPYDSVGLPYVYLNTKNNGFKYIGTSQFPTINNVSQWGRSASSILHDFDKDGVADLIVFPANGTSATTTQYHFYKGNRILN